MNKITQTVQYRQSLICYAEKHGVTKAAIRYRTNRQYIYRWRRRYDGTLQSLEDRSHRPRSHPNQHTEAEKKLIRDMRRRNPNAGLVVFWVKLWQRGYTRSISGLYRYLRKSDQMDNGTEFTKRLVSPKEYLPTLFERTLAQLGIRHKLIRPYTPRHNGKVERSHRKDNEELYASHKFYSFDDFKKQLAVRQRQYNAFPMRPLRWLSPEQVLRNYLSL